MRLFLAIELPQVAREHLVRVRDRLAADRLKASFTRDENLHITLRFLGEVPPGQIEEINASMSVVRASGGIDLRASGLEFFPARGQVRVIAAGFDGSLGVLRELHRTIEQRCRYLGFDRETRAYLPHATLARGRPGMPASVRSQVADLEAQFPGPGFTVREFVLMASTLRPTGSEYRVVARFALKSDPNIY